MPNSKIIRTAPEAQGDLRWTRPVGTLGELVAKAEIRSAALDQRLDRDAIAGSRRDVISLSSAFGGDSVGVIAEIKRSSPSRGEINVAIESGQQAARYEEGGAAAISVLTEPERFGGSDEDIERARSASSLPILKKDFHVTEAQLDHAASLGVSAALVIVRAVDPARLENLARAARQLELEILFEIRDERELEQALAVGAQIIGVNNRNLETLVIDPDTVSRLVPLIPGDLIAVAESGYATRESVENAAECGADAVLVGSSLSGAGDPAAAVRQIASVPRRSRSAG